MKKVLLMSGIVTLVLGMIFTVTNQNPVSAAGLEKWPTPGPGNNNPNGQMPQDNHGQMPQDNLGQLPQNNNGQMPQDNFSQMPQDNRNGLPKDDKLATPPNLATPPAFATPMVETTLSDTEEAALLQVIDAEYYALNIYKSVIAKFGNVSPFNRIADSEDMETKNLARLMGRYEITVPQNPGLTSTPVYSSLQDACTAAVAIEKSDAALYESLMSTTTNPFVNRVYSSLKDASLKNHVPAFQACK